jgi:hypothetical protein
MFRATRIIAVAASVLAATALVALPAQAARPAGKTSTLTFPVTFTSAGTTLGSVPGGHTYGWNDLQGTTKWGNQAAKVQFLGVVNYTNGSGPFGGFITVTRADGTQLAFSADGMAITPINEAGTADAQFSGTVTVIGGSGAYQGSTGFGTMKGARKASLGGKVQLTFTLQVTRK